MSSSHHGSAAKAITSFLLGLLVLSSALSIPLAHAQVVKATVPVGKFPYGVAYGSLVLINPKSWRLMLPYGSLYALGLVSPLFMLDALGAPMAVFSSYVAAGITGALGLHVAWQGVTFGFVSAAGEPISSMVTPACSAVYSLSIYLALLGLMYLDIRAPLVKTAKFAITGVLVIPLLNSARIAITIWFGYLDGAAAFWGIHDWLGYSVFLGFYLVVLVLYAGAWKKTPPGSRTGSSRAGPL